MEGWYADQPRPGGALSSPRWGYEQGPPRYSSHVQQHQQQHSRAPPYPPPNHFYDERGASPYHRPSPPTGYAPYSYVQQPSLDEKTVLRKKFSWKHFPEVRNGIVFEHTKLSKNTYNSLRSISLLIQLERFLIENRDDYLKFSSRNYTVEQKQFNNMLTERLIELSEKHSYVFDPEEFNFVAIRDRIRCYYKSYVQTARKRGLLLPTDKTKADTDATDVDEAIPSEYPEVPKSVSDEPSQVKEERE